MSHPHVLHMRIISGGRVGELTHKFPGPNTFDLDKTGCMGQGYRLSSWPNRLIFTSKHQSSVQAISLDRKSSPSRRLNVITIGPTYAMIQLSVINHPCVDSNFQLKATRAPALYNIGPLYNTCRRRPLVLFRIQLTSQPWVRHLLQMAVVRQPIVLEFLILRLSWCQ